MHLISFECMHTYSNFLLDIFLRSTLSSLLNTWCIWYSTFWLFLYTRYNPSVSSSTLNSILFFILPSPYFLILDLFWHSTLWPICALDIIWMYTLLLELFTRYFSSVCPLNILYTRHSTSVSSSTLNSILFSILPSPYFSTLNIFWYSTLPFLLRTWYTSNICSSTPTFYLIFFFSLFVKTKKFFRKNKKHLLLLLVQALAEKIAFDYNF